MWYVTDNNVFMYDEDDGEMEKVDLNDIIPKELIEFITQKLDVIAPKNIEQWKISKALIHLMGTEKIQESINKKATEEKIDSKNYDIVTLDTIWQDEQEWTIIQ